MLYTATYTATYDADIITAYPSDYTNFVEVSTPTDTYPSDYTDYYYAEVSTPPVGHLAPYNLGVNVSLDSLEVSYVEFRRRPHPGRGKGRK